MSVPTADASSTASACCSDVVVDSPETCNITTEDSKSSVVPNTLEQTERTSLIEHVGRGVNAAHGSSCTDSLVVDDSVMVAGSSADKMHNEFNPSVVRIEPAHPTEAADQLTSLVAEVTPVVDPVSGPLLSTVEQCRSDVVTFNLPLEVIGACWFMKRDTATCLQATTSNDGLFCRFCAMLYVFRF